MTAALIATALGAAACGSSTSTGATTSGGTGATPITVQLTSSGCTLSASAAPAGPARFTVTNKDADAVTEAELVSGSRILGEKENIAPGLSGAFSLDLQPGTYSMKCPGGSGPEEVPFTVTGTAASSAASGSAGTGSSSAADGGALQAATTGYVAYVQQEVGALETSTEAFVDAVKAGDIAKAKSLYGPARVHYERIEPVAESFGDLDPEIDARIADVADPSNWTGFHRLEKALWADKSLTGMTPVAEGLEADVENLNTLVQTVTFQPAQLANGATELLDEVSRSKITGEEEAYSHIDLVDFQANVDGARKAFELLEPALKAKDADLAGTISERFDAVSTALKKYRTGDGPTDFQTYDRVPAADHKVLAGVVDALAEPLSQVAAEVVGS
ncbi:MAG TPA: iron uptake system protein EfeO [Mycobacteriales bacterium]|nr:iron uptake system protein EfeO [Mycobacteriales bacterium]